MDNIAQEELDLYPLELQPIIEVLFRYEENLSDGFAYYMTIDAMIEHPSDLFVKLAKDLRQAALQGVFGGSNITVLDGES